MKRVRSYSSLAFLVYLLSGSPLYAWVNAFQPFLSLPTNVSPRGIAIGNVFGDGTKEVVIANFGSSTFIGQSTSVTVLNTSNSNIQIFSPSSTGLQLKNTIPTASSPRGLCLYDPCGMNRQAIFVTAYDANLLQVFKWSAGQFVTVADAPTLKMPVGVAAGLSRKGGVPLVAVADYGSSSLSLYPLKGIKLGKRIDIPVDDGPTQVAIGDLNSSGINQIAVVCLLSNKIDILSLGSTGSEDDLSTFKVSQTLSLPNDSAPSDLRIADLNNDSRLDLVVSDFTKNTISIFLQQKDGSLLAQPSLPTSGSHPNGLTVADLYGNGQNEIIVANRDSDSIDLFQPIGGQYQITQTLKTSDESNSSFGPVEVAAMDTRGIGKMDLVVSHMRSNSIKVLAQTINEDPTPTVISTVGIERGPFSDKTTTCYPNPTHDGKVKFSFILENPSTVFIQIYDVYGERVWNQTMAIGQTQSGVNVINWSGTNQNGQNLASGLYLYRITVGDQTVTKKLAIIH